jgi:AcrR family transcriptional regulator
LPAKLAANSDTTPRMRGRPRKSGGQVVTPLKLLDSAEELFAQRGFYGVTTREVAKAASCDDALIYYHFGNKQGLFEAVFARRATIANEVRRVSLRAYESANSGAITVRGAVAAFIDPLIDLSQSGDRGWSSWFAMVAQVDNTPWGGDIIHRFFDPVVYELIAVVKQAFGNVPDRELYWAYNFLAGSMMLALSESCRVDRLSYGLCRGSDMDNVRERLIDFCAGGFQNMVGSAGVRNQECKA